MVRDQLKMAIGELLEQKERTTQLENLNTRNAEHIQVLSENFARAGNAVAHLEVRFLGLILFPFPGADFALAKSANEDIVSLRARVATLEEQLKDSECM